MTSRLATDDLGDGPAVLFVHGFPLDRWIWHHQIAALQGHRRIAPDLRGLGATPVRAGPTGMGAYAADLEELLDERGVATAVLVGLSMGGYVAFECLRRWPERVRGLVLMDTRSTADTEEGRAARDRMAADARAGGARAIAAAMLPKLVGATTAAAAPPWLAELRDRMERMPVEGLVGALEAMKTRPDSTPLLPAIGVPALVVVGAEDVITPPAEAEAMARQIPGCDLAVVPGAGHLPPLEQPEAVTGLLRGFLTRVG